jgi:hypothetical protein
MPHTCRLVWVQPRHSRLWRLHSPRRHANRTPAATDLNSQRDHEEDATQAHAVPMAARHSGRQTPRRRRA